MTPETRNFERFNRIADLLEREPELYDQSDWLIIDGMTLDEFDEVVHPPCGTVACVAGHAIIDAGYGYDPSKEEYLDVDDNPIGDDPESIGAHLLGLSNREAAVLFDGEMKFNTNAPTALRALARNARVSEVVDQSRLIPSLWQHLLEEEEHYAKRSHLPELL